MSQPLISATLITLSTWALVGCGSSSGDLECGDGYEPRGDECVDLDECAGEGSGHDCDEQAMCTNTPGGFSCACGEGYAGDGQECTDLDECAGEGGGHDCGVQATCANTAGSYLCTCDAGYTGDGRDCVDLDECAGDDHECHETAFCINTDGGYDCECIDGYGGDGRDCVDLDECAGQGGGHDCHADASCINSAGGFSCECNPGYVGSGHECTRIRGPGLVIVNATLIDGTGAAAILDSAVVVVDGLIVEVGLVATTHLYPDDEVLDVAGRTLMPGVINTHVHGGGAEANLDTWAQAGVTTVRDVGAPLYPPPEWSGISDWDDWAAAILGGSPAADLSPPALRWRDEQLDRPESARALMAGPCITADGGYPGGTLSLHVNAVTVMEGATEITPADDARRKTQLLLDAGVDVIKICIENHWNHQPWGLLTEAQVAAIVETAHAAGARVTAHVSADERLATCLTADPPIDSAAHIVADAMSDANIAAMVAADIMQVPTLAVWESLSWICGTYGMCDEISNLGRFVDAGGRVALGDDYGNPGITLGMPLHELELMSEAGMTNMEILVAATSNGAIECGLDGELGTVAPDRIADLIVLDADPLVDIANLDSVSYVIHDGVLIREP